MLRQGVIATAALTALVMGGHRMLPELGGVTPVLESLLPWLGVAVPFLLAGAVVARSGPALATAVVPGLVWGLMFGPDLLRSGPGGPSDLSVATLNIGAATPDQAKAVRAVAKGRDLLALQELRGGGLDKVLDERFPHHFTAGTVGLWSRYPITETRRLDLGLGWPRALRAVVRTPKGDVTVYVVHLASARPGETAVRDRTLAEARRVVDRDDSDRLLLLGDLNTATTDRKLRGLAPPLTDAQTQAGTGFGFTWPSVFPVTRPDHILYRGLKATRAGVETAPGSDHLAAVAWLRM
ncbi:endonuclease/exonuclease/phosphatase family protein [Sinosporangium siamense]|uniref:Teicoplanin resistance protein VanJ n=1 Tax=Sinosporangium siamense TaxID=1367973 RepID=A0A919V503_9ACTN|nr:endonuclease/exonuclease/phosphatase family protein [Sinosporangium siamense]GII90301.1 teicoplanin resistance protein VanJ [Sinosporangium siamense]